MDKNSRDYQILKKAVQCCLEIEHAHGEYGHSYEAFCSNPTYRNAVALCLLQIGELSGKLSEEFKKENQQIPWHMIKGMKKAVILDYGKIDDELLWKTAEDGLQELRQFCQKELDGGFAFDVRL